MWLGTNFENTAPGNLGDFANRIKHPEQMKTVDMSQFKNGCEPYCYLFESKVPYQVGVGFTLNPLQKATGIYQRQQELRIQLQVNINSQVLPLLRERAFQAPFSAPSLDTFSYATLMYRELIFEPNLDVSYLFLTSPERKLVGYIGFGARLGTPIISKMEEYYNEGTSLSSTRDAGRAIIDLNTVDEYKELAPLFSTSTRLYMPFGGRYTLNKHLQLCLEVQPAFAFRNYWGNGKSIATPSLGLMLGLRMPFNMKHVSKSKR